MRKKMKIANAKDRDESNLATLMVIMYEIRKDARGRQMDDSCCSTRAAAAAAAGSVSWKTRPPVSISILTTFRYLHVVKAVMLLCTRWHVLWGNDWLPRHPLGFQLMTKMQKMCRFIHIYIVSVHLRDVYRKLESSDATFYSFVFDFSVK